MDLLFLREKRKDSLKLPPSSIYPAKPPSLIPSSNYTRSNKLLTLSICFSKVFFVMSS